MSEQESTIQEKLEYIARPFKEGEYEKIIQACNEIIAEDDDCYAAYSARSHIFYRLGRYSDAFRDLDRLMKIRPHSPSAYVRRAEWNLERGNDELAIDDINFVIESGDEYFINVAYFYRAVAFLNLGNKAEAMNACLKLPDDFKFQIVTPRWGGRLLSRDDIYRMATNS